MARRLVSLSDLVGVAQIATQFGVSKQAVSMWANRYADFPDPVAPLAAGPVYLLTEVAAWHARRWPPYPTGAQS